MKSENQNNLLQQIQILLNNAFINRCLVTFGKHRE